MDEEVKRSRAKKKLLKVTFPNGKVICYNNATSTMIAVLNEIGEDLFSSIKLEMSIYLSFQRKYIRSTKGI